VRFIHGFAPEHLRGDILGGVTAAVVALPLALAFGVASGAGPIAGLYGAIAVGFFAALFGGTPAQVSGPTGPMTVVMAAIVTQYAGNLVEAFTIVMLGGLLQILFGALRLGRYVAYTPYSVVSGFMSGIGVIIIIMQTLPFFGLATATGGPFSAIREWADIPAGTILDAVAVAVISLVIMVAWPKPWRAILPPPLAALIVGTLSALFLFPAAPTIGHVPTGLPALVIPTISLSGLPGVLQAAFILALLGSIDSLLTSLIADSVTRTQHRSDRELIGQGIGNIVAGLIGGLPGAGATMRTVVNVRAGGRTPISGMVHALLLFALAMGLGPLAEKVPHAVLAGILLKIGWDIIDWGYLKRIRRAPTDNMVVMVVTMVLTVFVDLVTAVAAGIIIASFVSARWLEKEQLRGIRHVMHEDDHESDALTEAERARLRTANGSVVVTTMHGSFSYASARELARRAGRPVSAHKTVIFDFTHVAHVDTSAALAIEELFERTESGSQRVYVSGLEGEALRALNGLEVLAKIPEARRFAHRADAIDAAIDAINREDSAAPNPQAD
jgi:SulP family sulfate permease